MNRFFSIVLCVLLSGASLFAQEDKKDVRRGNKDYRKSNFKEAEIDYRKALLKDSTSFAATYDLANALYSQKDYEGAANTLEKLSKSAPESQYADRYYFNKGNVSLQKKDYKTAVDDFKQALLRDPGDLQAKESYIYAKKMAEKGSLIKISRIRTSRIRISSLRTDSRINRKAKGRRSSNRSRLSRPSRF